MIQRKNTCKHRNSQDQITLYRQGHFVPLNGGKKSIQKVFGMTQISNIVGHSNQCGDKCSAIYKEYSSNKNPCPSAIFDPLLKLFTESSKSWSLVTTEDEKLIKDLQHIQAISQANSAILTQVVNNKAFTSFCPHVINLLFKAYKSMKSDTRENDHFDDDWNYRHHSDIGNDHGNDQPREDPYDYHDDENFNYGDNWNQGTEHNGRENGHSRGGSGKRKNGGNKKLGSRGENHQNRNRQSQSEDQDYYEDYSQDFGSGDLEKLILVKFGLGSRQFSLHP